MEMDIQEALFNYSEILDMVGKHIHRMISPNFLYYANEHFPSLDHILLNLFSFNDLSFTSNQIKIIVINAGKSY